MRRREFTALLVGLGGIVAARSLSARAQPADRMRRVGMMLVNSERDVEGQTRLTAFRQALEQLGWSEGQNIRIDYRWAIADPDRAQRYTTELLASAPEVVVANGSPALAALQRETRTTPIVFIVVTDPVGAGYVESLARPGRNVTGFSTFEPEIGGKWLELLKGIAPDLRRVAGILDPGFPGFASLWGGIEATAPKLGIELTQVVFRDAADNVESAVTAHAQHSGSGLLVLPTAINNISRGRIFTLAARHRLPAVYPFRHFAIDGGLMSYGFDAPDLFRRAASYVDRILRGEKPAELPVQAPTKFEFVINLKTANELGLSVPQSLLARADEVIE